MVIDRQEKLKCNTTTCYGFISGDKSTTILDVNKLPVGYAVNGYGSFSLVEISFL